jgi:peptide/nickel transport system substrate-binding protein
MFNKKLWFIFVIVNFLINNFVYAKTCDFGYTTKGAIAMHGQPDIHKTNQGLCALFQHKKTPLAKILNISEQERFSGLNYLISKGNVSYSVRPWIVDTLMYRSEFEPFTMYPNIAEISDINNERSFVTFKINPQAYFSDKTFITVHDVLFSFNKLKQQGLYNYQIAYKDISATLLNDREIRFDFHIKNRELPLILGLMPIFSHKTTQEDFSIQDLTPPVMANPYKIVDAEIGKYLTLQKNHDYWGLSTPQGKARFHFETVKFNFFQNDFTVFENLRAGQSDFFYESNLKRLNNNYNFPAIKNGDYKINIIPTGRPAGMYSFVLNARNPFLQDMSLRQAMFLAFDFQSINQDYLFNNFSQVDSFFAGSELAYYNNGFKKNNTTNNMRQRLYKAHQLLKNNGYIFKSGYLIAPNQKKVSFHLLLNDPNDEKFAGALKKDLKKIGITLTIQTVDTSLYQHHLTKFNYDIIMYSWYNSLSPGIEQKNYWHCDSYNRHGSRNYAGICNPNIDAAVNKLIITDNRQELVKAVAKLDFELIKNFYFIPLYGQQNYTIITKKTIVPLVGGATYFYEQ